MPGVSPTDDPFVLSYFGLRRIVGWIAVLFPFVFSLGYIVITRQLTLLPSLSDYYYTFMRNIFEGSLCAIGLFLAATYGYDCGDAIAGRIAGFAAIGVAWFPCKDPCTPHWVSNAHVIFACSLFLTLAFFCLYQFPKSAHAPGYRTPKKNQRNKWYLFCGWTIVVCIVLGLVTRCDWKINPFQWHGGLFWFESVAIFFFGVAWLIKGENFLKDDGAHPTPLFIVHRRSNPPGRID